MARRETTARPQLVAAKSCSQEYGFKYTSLRDLGHRGEIPVVRVGRAWYFDRRDVEHWIENQKRLA
jgi:excisionase family DNA binding protein